jgi:hypothetical protein
MTDADQNQTPPDLDAPATPAASLPPFASSLSTLISGVIAMGALALVRAAVIGPNADRPARLLLLLGGVGVPFSLMAVLSARSAKKHHADDPQVFVVAAGFAAAAVIAGAVGLSLLLGPASDADYQVPLWQIETEPVVTLIVGLAAMALALGSRGASASDGESVAGRRITAVIGACVAMPLVRRLLGRTGDEGLSAGWTLLLVLFDLLALAAVAVVAYRGFGIGRDLPEQLRSARSGTEPGPETPVEPI